MSQKDKQELLDRIFSTAVVKDIDFSNWQDSIDLYVISELADFNDWGEYNMVLVEFQKVTSFNLEFKHYAIDYLDSQDRLVWDLSHSTIEKTSGGKLKITLSAERGPNIQLECEDVNLRYCAPDYANLQNKEQRANNRFYRPSVIDYIDLLRQNRNQ